MGKGRKKGKRGMKKAMDMDALKESSTTSTMNGNTNRSLYICSIEYKYKDTAYVVHAIKLSDLLSCRCHNPTTTCYSCSSSDSELLRQVAYKAGENLPGRPGCGVFRTQILFAGGNDPNNGEDLCSPFASYKRSRELYVFETDDTKTVEPLIEAQKFPKFLSGKSEPLVVEVCGKIYALPGIPFPEEVHHPQFEVFDPTDGTDGKWSPLPQPPFINGFPPYSDGCAPYYSYAVVGTNILVSSPTVPHVFAFDVADDSNPRWEIASFEGALPFPGRALTVFDDDGDCLLFSYQYDFRCPPCIMLHLISNGKLETIKVLHLPNDLPDEFREQGLYSFAHLGGQIVCLVITCFVAPGKYYYNAQTDAQTDAQTEKMRVLVITLEFSRRDIHFRSTRIFDYDTMRSEMTPTICGKLLGCFVLSCYGI